MDELLTRILDSGYDVKFWMGGGGKIGAEIVGHRGQYVAEGWGFTPADAINDLRAEMERNHVHIKGN